MRLSLAIAALPLLVVGGCSESGSDPFPVVVRVETETGRAVMGAHLSRSNRPLGVTGVDGRATVKVSGVEGEIADLTVTCPEGYQSPPRPLGMRLTRATAKSKMPEVVAQCAVAKRRVVVMVRAENGPNLPVTYLDRPVTRTDAAGAATLALEVPAGAEFKVGLDTSERKEVRPVSPSKLFVVSREPDDILRFDQRFEVDAKAPQAL